MSPFTWASLGAYLAVVIVALLRRGRFYAIFIGIVLGLHTLISPSLRPYAGALWPLFDYLQATVYLHFVALIWAKMRPLPYRLLVSVPASFFVATTFLAWPWAAVAAFDVQPPLLVLPYALGLLGLYQSLYTRSEAVDVVLDAVDAGALKRWNVTSATQDGSRPLRIVQITDPHLGPFMPERRLHRICQRAVDRKPDLILLTGDYLTMESRGDPDVLGRALAPLRTMRGRVFACRGNHDHEAPLVVARGMSEAGVVLLNDEEAIVDTPAGPVQILGIDYRFRDRRRHIESVCTRLPRRANHVRLVLLHDPGAFTRVPDGEADLVFSGHTHGGHLGLLSFGLRTTIVSAFTRLPDHGLWACGHNRLYVHRGTGHYGFPLRVGVPAEESLLRVHLPSPAKTCALPRQPSTRR